MSILAEFLKRNSVIASKGLPLVQTVPALKLVESYTSGVLATHECDVFRDGTKGEQLNYFFVGRPAYKVQTDKNDDPAEWELPCCFIFEFDSVPDVKRIYPFDTGAHHERLYPHYINMIDKDHYEASSVPEATGRIIGAFFGDADKYYHMKPKSIDKFNKEYSLTTKDPQIRALHKLANHTAPKGFDDRRFAIEVQSGSNVNLNVINPLAVVLPSVYLDDDDIKAKVETWGAEPLDYPMQSLSVSAYYGMIYNRILDFYKQKKFL